MVAPPKWVVPGRKKPWTDPAPAARRPGPRTDRRLLLTFAAFTLALGLGALVFRLSLRERPAPETRAAAPVAVPPRDGVYESENVQIKFKPLPAPETQEESP